ncbi:MAG: hypothetical protein R2875_08180 [Desulfobacterales bacterium]
MGAAQALLDESIKYCNARKQFENPLAASR